MKKRIKKVNRKIKDTVFTTLFKIPKYKLELYNDILKEYIEFSHRCGEFRKKKQHPTEKDILKFINGCIKDNILREFLSKHKEEIMSTQTMLFDQDYVTEMWKNELVEDAKNEGRQEGMQAMLDRLVSAGLINKKEAEKQLSLV